MKVQYKNETRDIVNIRGLRILPGASVTSHVFLKHFEDEVKKGNLSIYVDGDKIELENAGAIKAEATPDETIPPATGTEPPSSKTPVKETEEQPDPLNTEDLYKDGGVSDEEIADFDRKNLDDTETDASTETAEDQADSETADEPIIEDEEPPVEPEAAVPQAEASAEAEK